MSALSSALAYRRLLDTNATLRMLRADHLPVMAATLGTHLGKPGTRISTEDLHESIDSDLEELRDHFDLSTRTAKAYCDDWRRAEILVRRPATSARGETYELPRRDSTPSACSNSCAPRRRPRPNHGWSASPNRCGSWPSTLTRTAPADWNPCEQNATASMPRSPASVAVTPFDRP